MAPRRSTLRRVRAVLARVGVGFAALVLLLGVLRGGSSYFFCPVMNAVFDAPCCGEDHADDDENDVSSVRAPDCCKAKRLGTLPSSALSSAPDVAASPCIAVVPAVDGVPGLQARATIVRFTQPARAGPPTAKQRRADLMVWHS